MSKRRIIPFKILPISWGLKGKSYERAKIDYELEGLERDIALAKVDYSGNELKKKLLEIDKEYLIIDKEEYQREIAKITYKGKELKQKLLDIDFEHLIINEETYERETKKLNCDSDTEKQLIDLEVNLKYKRISEIEYAKNKANILNEPWVGVVRLAIDPKKPNGGGAFELDFNELYVDELRKHGYTGLTSSHVIQNWFDELCALVAIEGGIVKRHDEDIASVIRNNKLDGDLTEYS